MNLINAMQRIPVGWLACLLISLFSFQASAQTAEEDQAPQFLPGLRAEFHWQQHTSTRIDADVLFDWNLPSQQSSTPASIPLPFSATWSGHVWAREPGTYQLQLFAAGQATVSLAGQELLNAESISPQWLACEKIELEFGYHELRIEYRSAPLAPRLGLYWSGPSFELEPLGSQSLFHDSQVHGTAHRSSALRVEAPAPLGSDQSGNEQLGHELGHELGRALRCAACHDTDDASPILAAPALTHLDDNLRSEWLVQRLTQQSPSASTHTPADAKFRQSSMPDFGLSDQDARDITAALFSASQPAVPLAPLESELTAGKNPRDKVGNKTRTTADAAQGKLTFVSTGCLACHNLERLGESNDPSRQRFGGGDLSAIASKRTLPFLQRWLQDPGLVNPSHRMPSFELSPLERMDLIAFLSHSSGVAEGNAVVDDNAVQPMDLGDQPRGARLIAQHRCGACHTLPESLANPVHKTSLFAASDWMGGCLNECNAERQLPGFSVSQPERQALQASFSKNLPAQAPLISRATPGEQLIRENNCTACHARDSIPGIKPLLNALVSELPELAVELAALAPPSLNAIGDKLHERALIAAIARQSPPLRPWLKVRMPRYDFTDEQLSAIADAFVAHDRIPSRDVLLSLDAQESVADQDRIASALAASRLVTAEGFGCQSCHAIGDGPPPLVDLNARGTNLAMLGNRIRASWFERWVRNPARIVPRMEMPAIQLPVRGVLHDSLDEQLTALWMTLNTPDFRPPLPRPVRILRTHNLPDHAERAWLLTEVLEAPEQLYLRPLVIGLANRHNFLIDLQQGRLATWWMGDVAHQHTRGKTWFWEPGGSPLVTGPLVLEQISLIDAAGRTWTAAPQGQNALHWDSSQHLEHGLAWQGRLHLTTSKKTADDSVAKDDSVAGDNARGSQPDDTRPTGRWLSIAQTLEAVVLGERASSHITTQVSGLEPGDRVVWNSCAAVTGDAGHADELWHVDLACEQTQIQLRSSARLQVCDPGTIEFVPEPNDQDASHLQWTSLYSSTLASDQFPLNASVPSAPLSPVGSIRADIVPGFAAEQLPLPSSEMPISLAWGPRGELYTGSLKGRVLRAVDSDADGLEDRYELISDELPAPYGLWASAQGIDALAKFGLVRLTPPQHESTADNAAAGVPYDATVIADGWGCTEDYHDWAVGLERDAAGNYYMALPCQQDQRSPAAAALRGTALKLIPSQSTADPRRYRIETLAAGLRFPMGLALSPQGELFASDNQGNYNPFNELNHLRLGKRYGFINKLENVDGFAPPFESPAIDLPHPWTRSVNGLCFLQTPSEVVAADPQRAAMFGAFEGHLIGCEMNGRSLIRMSLQRVGDTYQGAAYLFSQPTLVVEEGGASDELNAEGRGTRLGESSDFGGGFEGPIVCEVSPTGDIYVGNLHDSGWGGGQNTGSIVRLRPSGLLPAGIAEMRATPSGFEIDFTRPIDASRGSQASNYQLRSYQRISTPAYGGDDQDERVETVRRLQLSDDWRRVTLEVDELRAGFVYELNIGPVAADGTALFPSQAHYTLRSIPTADH